MHNKEQYKLMNQKVDYRDKKATSRLSNYSGEGWEIRGREEFNRRTCIHAYKYKQWTQKSGEERHVWEWGVQW